MKLLLEPQSILILLGVSVGLALGALIFVLRRHRRMGHLAGELLDLAERGRSDEARIKARKSGSELSYLLVVLGGYEEQAPSARRFLKDWYYLLMIASPVVAVTILVVATRSQEALSPASVASLIVATAVALPVTFFTALVALEVGVRTTRDLRGPAVRLLGQNVAEAAKRERAERIRTLQRSRDPRGA